MKSFRNRILGHEIFPKSRRVASGDTKNCFPGFISSCGGSGGRITG
jgi:hypothetical protein